MSPFQEKHPLSNVITDPYFLSKTGKEYVDWLDEVGPSTKQRPELRVAIILLPEFPLLSFTGIVEALRHAGDVGDQSRRLRCDWSIVSNSARPIRASCGVEVTPTAFFPDPALFDYVMVIGGLLRSMAQIENQTITYLRQVAKASIPIAGVCTGSFVLAKAGLMEGRVSCVHPYHVKDFQTAFPGMKVVSNQDYVIDKGRITVPGGVSIFSLMTHLISEHCGRDRASKTVHQISVPERAESSTVARTLALGYSHVADPRLKRAILAMEREISAPRTIGEIATDVGLSLRQFERLFTSELGLPPRKFYQAIRLRYARWLVLNTTQSISSIAYQTGFADCAHFVRDFKCAYDISPGKFRLAG